MIFATVGTERFSFDRLIKILDKANHEGKLEEEVFIQIGNSRYEPKNCSWKRFIEYEEMIKLIKRARVVVTHAGVGNTLLCLTLHKVPIVFPRDHKYGEHLDNHQIEFSKRMESEDKVIAAYDAPELIRKIKNYEKLLASLSAKFENKRKLADYMINLFC